MKFAQNQKISRLAIFFFYDKDGIVDEYIPYMLNDLKLNITELLVVINGKITDKGKEKLKIITPNIIERENKGFDVWAYKTGLEYYGWENFSRFDEVILMNFTMFGPLYPFKEMFVSMDTRDVDFWGITKHHGFPFDPFGTIPCGFIPEHIQSSFICIRKNMIESKQFKTYWNEMPPINSYGEAVGKHEAIFTKYFNDLGFRSDVYIQTDDLKEYTHYPLMIKQLELIKNRRCPVIKRKAFTNEYYEFLNCTLGEPTLELYNYIKENLDYDTDLIWDNLLRVENMADIKNRMHFNYILPDRYQLEEDVEKKKIALFLHIYSIDLTEYCMNYAKSMPEDADIYVTTDTEEKKKRIEEVFSTVQCNKFQVLLVENRGRDVSALLVGCKPYINNYDLVCFAHDKKTAQFEPLTIGESFSYKCFENILSSKNYVKNIITKFSYEKRLGMLMPPPPNHAAFYGVIGTEWGGNFDNTVKLAERLNIHVNFDITKEPISPLGTMFWFRPEALKTLLEYDWKFSDFPNEPNGYDGTLLHAVERIYGFAVQHEGYYPAWVMNDKFAGIEITNLHFMLRELSMSVYNTVGHQMGFNMANYNLLTELSLRKVIKIKLKNKLPAPIWKIIKFIYCKFGGKKWLG